MWNGIARTLRLSERASTGADALAEDAEVEIDLRSGEPEVSLQPRSVPGVSETVELDQVPVGDIADVVPLFETPVSAPPPAQSATESAVAALPVRGMLGRAISRADSEHATQLAYEASERASNVLVSTVLFLLLAPLLVILFVLVRFTSPGPALYRQERVGRDGSTFAIFKFRSMSIDADQRLDEMNELTDRGRSMRSMVQCPRLPMTRASREWAVSCVERASTNFPSFSTSWQGKCLSSGPARSWSKRSKRSIPTWRPAGMRGTGNHMSVAGNADRRHDVRRAYGARPCIQQAAIVLARLDPRPSDALRRGEGFTIVLNDEPAGPVPAQTGTLTNRATVGFTGSWK
jgi:hypothetical protein